MGLTRITAFGIGLAVVGACLVGTTTTSSALTGNQTEGLMCEPGDLGAAQANFAFSTGTGHVSMPDGNVVFSWGYSTGTHAFQLPGPVLCVRQNQKVTITLTNTLDEDTSLVFPGQDNVLADGVPSVPQLENDRVTSLAQVAGPKGGQVTYSFTATKPGTYLYESGTDPAKQVEMGLYGALIVYPDNAGQADRANAYGVAGTAFKQGREFIHILSQIDPDLHLAVEQKKPFDWSTYQAHYFLLNGRSAPDSVSPNDAAWLPSQPYGSMVHVREQSQSTNDGGDVGAALVRYINVMPIDAAFHPHGNTESVIAEDGQPLRTGGKDNSYGSFLVDIGANRTVDALFTWTNVEKYNGDPNDPNYYPVPVQISPYQDVLTTASTWYSMSPYLGQVGDLPAGVTSLNQCGEYYHMAHNHALQFATNFGASFGGQMTLIRIDPALGRGC